MASKSTWTVWIFALLLAAGIGFYQRRTGPSWPVTGRFSVGEVSIPFRLIRNATSGTDAEVSIPYAGDRLAGEVHYRRYLAGDEYSSVPLERGSDELTAELPSQPPAGKLEYFVTLTGPEGAVRLPREGQAVLRFKGAVPAAVLFPHVLMMFLSVLFGFRTAFAALAGNPALARLVGVTVALMTVGGMILGPAVQKYAFGEFWAGWPNGKDLTDNKMLLLWATWLAAGSVVLFVRKRRSSLGRVAIVAAAVVMVGVYLIPHSLRGSQLNYRKLDEGAAASEAIETG